MYKGISTDLHKIYRTSATTVYYIGIYNIAQLEWAYNVG